METIALMIILFAGGLIQGATGFGMAMVTTPFLVLILPVKTASIVLLLTAYVNVILLFYPVRKHIRAKVILPVVAGSIIGSSVGIYALTTFDAALLTYILGYCLIAFAVYFAFAVDKIKIKATSGNGLLIGLLSSVLGGMFNISGPPKIAYFYSATTSKEEYMASNQAVNIITMTYSIGLHIVLGNITTEVLKLSGTALVAALLGTCAGYRIFKAIRKKALNIAISAIMSVMGVLLLIQ